MTTAHTHTPLSVVLAPVALAALQDDNTGQVQILPCGRFSARDGRPKTSHNIPGWTIDDAAAEAVLTAWRANKTPLVVDYEHQSIRAASNGQPAPAAGWITALTWEPGRGMFATVEWTPRAAAMIRGGEYRCISPVITFDKTGQVTGIISVALTNTPALDELDAVTLTLLEDQSMSQPNPSATPAAPADATVALTAERDAATAQVATLTTERNDAVAQVATLTAERDAATVQVAALNVELTKLKTGAEEARLGGLVDVALADGRLQKALEPWARGLATSNPAALTQFLDQIKPIAALTGMQTAATGGVPAATTALTAEEKAVCTRLGMTEEQYRKEKGTV